MKPAASPLVLALCALCLAGPSAALQQPIVAWGPPAQAAQIQPLLQQQQQFLAQPEAQQQFGPRPAIPAELQNQVQALSAQLAAANRQIQYYQQQLSIAAAERQQVAPTQPPVNQPIQASQTQLAQQQLAQQQQFLAQQLALQQQQQQQQQQQPAPQVSTLLDGSPNQLASDPRLAGEPQVSFFQQQQQPQAQLEAPRVGQFASQQVTSQAPTSTTADPPALEPSLMAQPQVQQQPQQQQLQAPPADQGPVHAPSRNDDKFSIGLGVLSPGYTQKFGNTALDFNQDKNGFSFTLSNNGHNNQPPKTPSSSPASA